MQDNATPLRNRIQRREGGGGLRVQFNSVQFKFRIQLDGLPPSSRLCGGGGGGQKV